MSKVMMIQLTLGLLIGGSFGALMGYFGKCSTGACPLTANPMRGMMWGAMLGAILSFSMVTSPSIESSFAGSEAVVQIKNADDFREQVIHSNQPVLVDFYSNTCSPCRKLSPVIAALAEQFEGRAIIAKVNVNRLSTLASQYQIQGIPAVLFYQDGQETKRIIGYQDRVTYADQLERMIKQTKEPIS